MVEAAVSGRLAALAAACLARISLIGVKPFALKVQVNLLIAILEGFLIDGLRSAYKAFQTHAHDSCVKVYACGFIGSCQN